MTQEHILVVDDEEDILELVEFSLKRESFEVDTATTGEQALKMAREDEPDLMVLDLMLPGVDGLEVCRQLKADSDTSHMPVVMLTAKGSEADIVTGLELGADDYVTKPFSPRVLVARIKAVLRRQSEPEPTDQDVVRVHDIEIHPGRHEVIAGGDEKIELTYTEFRILHLLARRPGWVYTRYQIVDGVRGENYPVTDRSVDVHIAGLRKKLGDRGDYIETVRGVGYRFKD
jgi:two-component system phosphate regulon response regulator PhoB